MDDCELCGVSFRESDAYREHMQQHLDLPIDASQLYECANCRRSFFRSQDLERHGLRVHA